MRGFDKMTRSKRTSKRSRDSGKTRKENPRLSEHALDEAHAQVTRSKERWRAVFENSVIGVALTDLNGQFVATNPAYQRMLGYTDEELQQFCFLDLTVEKYREHNWALVEKLLEGKHRQFQIEKQYRRKDGSLVWARNSVSIVPGTERVPRFIMTLCEEITEDEKAEESPQASDVKLRRVIDTIPALVWCNLPDGSNEFRNKRWHEFTGLSPEESQGWGWQVALHPEDLSPLMTRWQEMLASGEPAETEARIRGRDGVYRWFLIRAEPFRDENGRIVRWYGTSTDIDELKRAEQHLRRGEAFLADGQRLSKAGTFLWSIETNEVTWSQELYAVFDFDPSLPVTLELIGSRVHPEDRPMLEDMIAGARRAEAPFEYEYRIVTPEGSIKYIHLIGHATHNVEGRLEYLGAAQDVTQRRMTEEKLRERELNLRRITQAIPGMLWSATPEGAVDYCNNPWLDFAAMTAEQAMGWGWATAIYPDDRDGLIERWRSCLASGTPFNTEARIRRFDGAFRWFLFRADPLRDESGTIIKWYGTNIDIEDRKRAERMLRATELSWRQIVDNIPGFVYTTTATGEVEFLSRQIVEYFGKTNEELKDWSRLGMVHPDDLPRVIGAWRKSIETGQTLEIEQRFRRADGVYRWFQARGRPVRNTQDEITAWYWLLTDIEDRKKAEEALQSNERNLNLMINAIPTFIQVSRPDGTVLSVNQAVLDYHGLRLEDVRKEDFRNRFYHPDDVKRLGEWRVEALKHPAQFEYEQRALGKDGKYRWFLVRYNPLLDEQGRIDRWYAGAFDIEDRKQAEAQLEQAYLRLTEAQRLSKTGSFITDLLADEHNWSEEAYRIFDFDPATKVSLHMIRDLIHPEDLAAFDDVIARGVTGNDVDFAFRIVTSRGTAKHIRGVARVIEHIAGRPLFIGALQDVTASKIAEEALSRARSELAHVARVTTLNALTASITHEINQPLSGIVTNANTCLWLLSTDPPDVNGARETAQRTIRDGNRAADVIQRLRTLYSKKESRPESMDLNEATREVISLSQLDLQRNHVIVRYELADDLPPITGDRIQLQQVILNLVRNASDAMSTIDDRPRELLIKSEREDENRVRLSVKDIGVGFQPQAADKLFEAFYTTKREGMGIGLHVSRSIIEAHQGRLWGTANEGPGAKFSFTIPCRPEGLTCAETPVNRTGSATDQD
jgi:PAS domain S-box-containing protein